jgi:hypothetical protein
LGGGGCFPGFYIAGLCGFAGPPPPPGDPRVMGKRKADSRPPATLGLVGMVHTHPTRVQYIVVSS